MIDHETLSADSFLYGHLRYMKFISSRLCMKMPRYFDNCLLAFLSYLIEKLYGRLKTLIEAALAVVHVSSGSYGEEDDDVSSWFWAALAFLSYILYEGGGRITL